MKWLLLFFLPLGSLASPCECKCVVKKADGSLLTVQASGVDRESAGKALKQNLAGERCSLTPVCSGRCALDGKK